MFGGKDGAPIPDSLCSNGYHPDETRRSMVCHTKDTDMPESQQEALLARLIAPFHLLSLLANGYTELQQLA
jgi:hypothetical protein